MKKYVKKLIPIHAFRWDGKPQTVRDNMPKSDIKKYIGGIRLLNNTLIIKSLEGSENCKVGDMVIRGIYGEYYPCNPKVFKDSYKEVK